MKYVLHLEGGPLDGVSRESEFFCNYVDVAGFSEPEGRYHLTGLKDSEPGHPRFVWRDER